MSWTKAKQEFLDNFYDKHGYYFCESCSRSDRPLDLHHLIFRSQSTVNPHRKANLVLLGRCCHRQAHAHSGIGYDFCNKQIKKRKLKQKYSIN